MIKTTFYAAALVLLCTMDCRATYSTPNTGVIWTMADLVAHSGGKVTGSAPNYALHDDIFVKNSDTLTIPAGTTITRDDGGVWPTLVIAGKLIAEGTQSSPILFTSGTARGSSESFDRCLEFHSTASPNSIIRHVIVEHSDLGIFVSGSSGLTFANCIARHCNWGFSLSGTDTVLDGCIADTHAAGGIYVYKGSPHIIDCVAKNSLRGIYLSDSTAFVEGGEVCNNGSEWGAGICIIGGSPIIQGCYLYGNKTLTSEGRNFGGGIGVYNASNVKIRQCKFYNNRAQYGGGLFIENSSNVEIKQCHFAALNYPVDWDINNNGNAVQVESSTDILIDGSRFLSSIFYWNASGRVSNNVLDYLGMMNSSPLIAHNLVNYWIAFHGDSDPAVFNNIFRPYSFLCEHDTRSDPQIMNNIFEPPLRAHGMGIYLNEDVDWVQSVSALNMIAGNSGNMECQSGLLVPDNASSSPMTGYVLPPSSPAIDNGVGNLNADYKGTPRPLDGNADGTCFPDIGPVEYPSALLDSDGDLLSDADEVNFYGTNPLLDDSNGNGIKDHLDVFDFYGGDGTEQNPYIIQKNWQILVLDANPFLYSSHFVLEVDIDWGGCVFAKPIIASVSNPFMGVFNGNGHVISNFSIIADKEVAVFGALGAGGVIRDLGVVSGKVSGQRTIGGLCAINSGTLQRCYSSIDVTSVDSYGCVGSLVAASVGEIKECYATGSVIGAAKAGGLCGIFHGVISDSYATGRVTAIFPHDWGGLPRHIGGLVGYVGGNIRNSFSTGIVSGYSSSTIGGFCGILSGGATSSSFWNVETSNMNFSDGGIGCTTEELQSLSALTLAGWDFTSIWKMGGFPVLRWQGDYQHHVFQIKGKSEKYVYPAGKLVGIDYDGGDPFKFNFVRWITEPCMYRYNFDNPFSIKTLFAMPAANVTAIALLDVFSGGTGSAWDPFRISAVQDLLDMGNATYYYDQHFILTENIDLGAIHLSKAIVAPDTGSQSGFQGTQFRGSFDGNGKVIKGLRIEGDGHSDYLGVFGQLGPGSFVRRLGVDQCAISGRSNIGGLCGDQDSGTIVDCYVSGHVQGLNGVGGFCGNIRAGIISNCYSVAYVGGADSVGGFCGKNSSGLVIRSYSAGKVFGSKNCGGFSGSNVTGVFDSCFWDYQNAMIDISAGGIGKTTQEMQNPETFSAIGWDFVNTWQAGGFPSLRWQENFQQYVLDVNNGSGSGIYRAGTPTRISALVANISTSVTNNTKLSTGYRWIYYV